MSELSELVEKKMVENNVDQEQLAKLVGVSQPSISYVLSGKTKKPKFLGKLADVLDISEHELFKATGLEYRIVKSSKYGDIHIPEKEYEYDETPKSIAIPQYRNTALSAGPGCIAEDNNPDSEMYFKRSWIEYKGWNTNDLFVIYVKGESMEPTLHSGDVVLVHTGINKVVSGGIYAINDYGELKIKRIIKDMGTVTIKSDNPEHENIKMSYEEADSLEVLGMCVWKGSEFF